MPTYEYVCGGCKAVTDIFQQITEGRKRKCPKCGALKLKRQLGTGSGIIFKGPGFYATDYAKKSKNSGDTP